MVEKTIQPKINQRNINLKQETMSSLLKQPSELEVQKTVKALLYGQPGLGKTTLALSTPSPVLLDFDGGVHRVNAAHRPVTLQVKSWDEVIDVMKEDLSQFKTIVIDTAGKMLDFMSAFIIKNDDKMATRDGSLTLKGYGARKTMFVNFLSQVSMMGKHIIFVAHEKEEKDGEQKVIRPEIGGSSANDLMKELDLVGYMQAIGKNRTISFDPCEKFYAKNTCNLPSTINIPTIIDENSNIVGQNNLMGSIFDNYQKYQKDQQERLSEYDAFIDVIAEKIELIKDAETANVVTAEILEMKHYWDTKLKSAQMINDRCKELGLVFNKIAKKYEEPAAINA